MLTKTVNYDYFKLKKTFGLHGLYKKYSALKGLINNMEKMCVAVSVYFAETDATLVNLYIM